MELSVAVRERRSVRKFKGDDVSQKDLDAIMEAIRWAPSWANTQCWDVIVVRKAEIKKRLSETLPRSNPARGAMTQAPVILAVCARKGVSGFYKGEASTDKGDWFMFDVGVAMENLCLAAHSLGLGTVMVGLFDARKVESLLAVPENVAVVAMTPLGYPDHDVSAPRRKELVELVHHETYGKSKGG